MLWTFDTCEMEKAYLFEWTIPTPCNQTNIFWVAVRHIEKKTGVFHSRILMLSMVFNWLFFVQIWFFHSKSMHTGKHKLTHEISVNVRWLRFHGRCYVECEEVISPTAVGSVQAMKAPALKIMAISFGFCVMQRRQRHFMLLDCWCRSRQSDAIRSDIIVLLMTNLITWSLEMHFIRFGRRRQWVGDFEKYRYRCLLLPQPFIGVSTNSRWGFRVSGCA